MEVEPLNPPISRHFSLPDLVTFFRVITGGQGREADAKPVGSREKSIHPQMTGPLGAKKIAEASADMWKTLQETAVPCEPWEPTGKPSKSGEPELLRKKCELYGMVGFI